MTSAWCASFVSMVGQTALGSAWPLPLTAGCQVLADVATKKKILKATPAVGDVFLIWHPSMGRFAHTGFVLAVNPIVTISGNTTLPVSRINRLPNIRPFCW